MKSAIVFFLIFVFSKPSNIVLGQKAVKTLTLLKTESKVPGPSLRFNKSLASGIFEFEFKTFVDTALVLYQDDEGKSDHIQITFQEGRLWFLFYLNKNNNPGMQRGFTSERTYNDFEWHSIRIERNASATSFIVDNGEEIKTIPTYGYQSLFTSTLLIGGFDFDQYVNDLSNQGAFFVYVGYPTYTK